MLSLALIALAVAGAAAAPGAGRSRREVRRLVRSESRLASLPARNLAGFRYQVRGSASAFSLSSCAHYGHLAALQRYPRARCHYPPLSPPSPPSPPR